MCQENKPIRVLQMIASLDFGGSQNMIVNLYKAIDRTEVQFDFIVDHPSLMGLAPIVESLGAKIYYVPEFKGTNLLEVRKAWDELFKSHPEYKILHSHSRSYASIYFPIARKYGVKTIIHSHNTSNGKGIKAFIKDMMQYPLRYVADYFIGCSKEAGEWLFGKKVVNGDRFYVLNNAIDTDRFRYDPEIRSKYRELFNTGDKKVYIQVGAFRAQKNYDFSLRIIRKVIEKDNNCILYLVGNGPERQKIEDTIREYNLESHVKILLDRSDVECLLQMADCYIMPSVYEGLSVAAIEAEASGTACLFSDQVNKEVKVTDRVEFLPLEEEIWVDRMLNMSTHKSDTQKSIIESGFDIKVTSKWLKEFYVSIIDR